MVKLEDIVDLLPDMDQHPPDCPIYFNKKNQLDKKIKSIEYSKTTHRYEIVFKEVIDFDKFRKASLKELCYCDFLKDEQIMYVYHHDVLIPIMMIKNEKEIECYEDRVRWVISIIDEYLKDRE